MRWKTFIEEMKIHNSVFGVSFHYNNFCLMSISRCQALHTLFILIIVKLYLNSLFWSLAAFLFVLFALLSDIDIKVFKKNIFECNPFITLSLVCVHVAYPPFNYLFMCGHDIAVNARANVITRGGSTPCNYYIHTYVCACVRVWESEIRQNSENDVLKEGNNSMRSGKIWEIAQ